MIKVAVLSNDQIHTGEVGISGFCGDSGCLSPFQTFLVSFGGDQCGQVCSGDTQVSFGDPVGGAGGAVNGASWPGVARLH